MPGCSLHAQQSQDSIMITIFLKHQEDKNLDSIQGIQKKNHFGELFSAKISTGHFLVCDDGYRTGSHGKNSGLGTEDAESVD